MMSCYFTVVKKKQKHEGHKMQQWSILNECFICIKWALLQKAIKSIPVTYYMYIQWLWYEKCVLTGMFVSKHSGSDRLSL